MTDSEERYEGNGEGTEIVIPDTSPPAKHNSHGGNDGGTGADELRDSKSQRSRDHERESSKSRSKDRERGRDTDRDRDRERDRDKEKNRDLDREKSRDRDREKSRDRDRERDRDRDRDRHGDRDRYRERSERRERGRDRDDNYYHRSRDYDRRRDYDRDGEDRRSRHRSRSRSRAKSEHRSRSQSRSRSKSKRVGGFDMAPPASAILAGAAAITPDYSLPDSLGDDLIVEVHDSKGNNYGRVLVQVATISDDPNEKLRWWSIYREPEHELVGKIQLYINYTTSLDDPLKCGSVAETVAYDVVLEVAMKVQNVRERNLLLHDPCKWLLIEFASYYGVSDTYTKLRSLAMILITKNCQEIRMKDKFRRGEVVLK